MARTYRDSTFRPLLKVVNSEAYGPDMVDDMVEVVADVTRAAQTPLPAPAAVTEATEATD